MIAATGSADLTGLTGENPASFIVIKTKSPPRPRMEPLADGQMWHMADAVLQVTQMGKLLVHYKLGKPNAVRVANSIGSKTSVEKYLKKNKAVLVKAASRAVVKK